MTSIRFLAATPFIALLAACGGETIEPGTDDAAAPAADAPVEITQRQDNFEAIADSFKAIRTQLEGEPDFAVIASEAANMSDKTKAQVPLFPAGTSVEDGFDTEALPVIWEKPEEFQQAALNLVAAADTMKELAESGDAAAVGAHVAELGGACKACHDQFRVPKD